MSSIDRHLVQERLVNLSVQIDKVSMYYSRLAAEIRLYRDRLLLALSNPANGDQFNAGVTFALNTLDDFLSRNPTESG